MVDKLELQHHHCSQQHELIVEGLCVSYRKVAALDQISFATSCGNRVALVGPNGAGKSTLLKAIAGLVNRTCGVIKWRGSEVKKWSREFAYLPQREEVDWNFPITVRGIVEMGRYPQTGMFGRFSKTDGEKVDQAIASLLLEDLQDRQIRELSGGQQQRTFIARAIAQEAHVLLLDEPFAGLDPKASQLLGELIQKLAIEGRLILASHHDMNNVHELFNQALLIDKKLIHFGKCDEVISSETVKRVFYT
jgi:ABC-type Mn2+/Zn2+ transport system ATPase subunit